MSIEELLRSVADHVNGQQKRIQDLLDAEELREVERKDLEERLKRAQALYERAVDALRRCEEQSRPTPPPVDPPPVDPPPVEPPPVDAMQALLELVDRIPAGGLGMASPFDARTMAYAAPGANKALLQAVRRSRGWNPAVRTTSGGFTHKPYEAPDLGDIDFRPAWLWALNVALGLEPNQKTGNVDIERCTFAPGEKTPGLEFDPARDMNWGMRRYNLGDTYVGMCDFSDIPQEHGIYDSLAGHGLYYSLTFKSLGSQAIQMAYRDKPYAQYSADNHPWTKRPVISIEDCHAVDCGDGGRRPGFVYSLFDPGNAEYPGAVLMRNTTSVSAWGFARNADRARVPLGDLNDPNTNRASKGFVVHQFQQHTGAYGQTTDVLLQFNCLFDHTRPDGMLGAVRGVHTILFLRSGYLARGGSKQPYIDIDDDPSANHSRWVVIHDCHSPTDGEVHLRVRGRVVCSMHQPGRTVVVDVTRGAVVEGKDQIEAVLEGILTQRLLDLLTEPHPLASKVGTVPPGVTPQPSGHVDDMPN